MPFAKCNKCWQDGIGNKASTVIGIDFESLMFSPKHDYTEIFAVLHLLFIHYCMAFFIVHVISTRDIHISPMAEGPRANMGRWLIWHVI